MVIPPHKSTPPNKPRRNLALNLLEISTQRLHSLQSNTFTKCRRLSEPTLHPVKPKTKKITTVAPLFKMIKLKHTLVQKCKEVFIF